MRILHVLSGDFVSGAETYATTLAEEQIQRGHSVFIVCGRLSELGRAQFIPVRIYNRSYWQRLKNIAALVRIIHRQQIDLVHAHSRAASWVSHFAATWTKTAYISTIHGRQHVHRSFARHNVYGDVCITACEDIREQMLTETDYFKPEQVLLIRNGI